MELRSNLNEIKTNVEDMSSFKIQASAKAFKILSDQLYSDKIKAIVRELSTNAYDAHVSINKKNKPFEVTFPKNAGDNFIIRDFGPGMSEDHIINLYTSYFGSDKTNSNDFVGALGLGSKSPFAYTDSFVVTSWNGGMKKSYVSLIGQNGVPQISKLTEMECGKETGVEIKFPVKTRDDCASFGAKGIEVYRYFKVKPITNVIFPNTVKPIIFKGNGWTLKEKDLYTAGKLIAIMGSVAYPIVHDTVRNSFELLASNDFEIDFEIGALDVTPSREHLSYDAQTLKNIFDKLTEVRDDLVKKVQSKINKCESMFEARKLHLFYINKINHLQGVKHTFLYKKSSVSHFNPKVDDKYENNFYIYELSRETTIRRNTKMFKYHYSDSFTRVLLSNDTELVYNDLNTMQKGNNKGRALIYHSSGNVNRVIVFHPNNLTQEEIDDLKNKLGNPKFTLASTIQQSIKTTTLIKEKQPVVISCELNNNFTLTKKDIYYSIKDLPIDEKKNNVFLTWKRNSFYFTYKDRLVKVGDKRDNRIVLMSSLVDDAVQKLFLLHNTNVYIIKSHLTNHEFVQKNFIELGSFIKNKFNEVFKKKEDTLNACIESRKYIDSLGSNVVDVLNHIGRVKDKINPDSYASKIINIIEQKGNDDIHYYNILNMYLNDAKSMFSIDGWTPPVSIYDYYPMLKICQRHIIGSRDVDTIAEYINLVGK